MIKKIVLVIFLGFTWKVANSVDRPETIPSKLISIQAKGWYEEKVRSWKAYLTENPLDKEGWLQYFYAAKYAGSGQQDLNAIANQVSLNFRGSFEDDYLQAKLTGWTESGVKKMRLAFENYPKTDLFLADRIVLSEIVLDKAKRLNFEQRLYDSQTLYPSLLNYAYNVLMSVSDNGVLIVKGESTTIPLWVLQDVMSVRKDVKVLNLDLAVNDQYLSFWFKQNNLNKPKLVEQNINNQLVTNLPELNPGIEFYYGLTLPADELNSIEERLYVVGLASLHRNESFDHYEMLKKNVENKFLIDYLTVDFNGEPKTATGRVYETNYILPFLLLKEYYDNEGSKEKSAAWRDIILTLADRSQLKNRVAMLMENEPQKVKDKSFKKAELNIKKLDNSLKKIKDNLYASNHEVNNEEYWFYLDYLRTNSYTELYEKSLARLSKYDDFTNSLLANYHYSPTNMEAAKNNKTKAASYSSYPTMDITFEAAKAYCEWLTVQYNQQEGRKYKRVKFRLPSQKEWTMAALGYKEFISWNLDENTIKAYLGGKKNKKDIKSFPLSEYDVLYPWWYPDFGFRDRIQNKLECYMANVKTADNIPCPAGVKGDGFTLMSPVASYFANGLGLYDVVGNVSEMIDESGKAMGGSWNHPPEESTITSVNTYDSSSPSVGFRIFMEVIEE